MSGFAILVSVIGVAGVGGTVALAIFAPALALAAWQGANKIAGAVISTRLGCALVAGGLMLVAGELHGEHRGGVNALAQIEKANKEAADAARKAIARMRECVDAGGVWDTSTGKCH